MDIKAEKLELMEMLLRTESETVLEKLRTVFKSEKEDNKSALTEEQCEIVAEEQTKYHQGQGENYSWDEAKKIIRGK